MNFLPRTDKVNVPFDKLDVEESLRDETILEVFLTYWICKFVLSSKKVDYLDLQELYDDDLGNDMITYNATNLNDVDKTAKRPSALNFGLQETISHYKSSFVSNIWGALCELITKFSSGSLDNLENLEASIALIFGEIRKVNIIDISTSFVENFIKVFEEYDSLRSAKMTKKSH
ncbi:hypothetical protein FXO38_27164 [Capsicum annuum]|nr:hypothetical protein FXO38_27164 [Capsicum annuum]KAF3632618.1 hypothetical protein FXO37_27368 [Capsicum annuum]